MPVRHVGNLSRLTSGVMRRIISYLEPLCLVRCSRVCWTLFSLTNLEEVWKTIVLKHFVPQKLACFCFKGSWKHTALHPQRYDIADWVTAVLPMLQKQVTDPVIADQLQGISPWRLQSCVLPRFCKYIEHHVLRLDDSAGAPCTPLLVSVLLAAEFGACRSGMNLQLVSESGAPSPYLTTCPLSQPVFAPIEELLRLSSAAVNFFTAKGDFLRPPPSATVDPSSEYTLHNIVATNLFSLPSTCDPIECFSNSQDKHGERRLMMASPTPLAMAVRGGTHVHRRHRLSIHEFRRSYEQPNLPVVITGLMDNWPCMQKWTLPYLCNTLGDAPLRTNGRCSRGRRFRMRATDFLAYCDACHGEKPLYVFDKKIFSECPQLLQDYCVPEYFTEDFFELMDFDDRPDFRWILIGPHGSGTPFHTDPHNTSAWNAVVSGCKRVTFYPPDVIPPGVDEELIHSDYYASDPYMLWYKKHMIARSHVEATTSWHEPLETYVYPGEVVFIPSGWWHQVLNIGHTVAVTQNFCSSITLPRVIADMNAHGGFHIRADFRKALDGAGYASEAEKISLARRRK